MNPIDASRPVPPQAGAAKTAPAAKAEKPAAPAAMATDGYQSNDVRIVSYNTAVGAASIDTPQEDFTKLPLYQKALKNEPGAPIMTLQEVGKKQIEAAKRYEAQGTCKVIYQRVAATDQYNAIVVPARYKVEESESHHFAGAQLKGIVKGAWNYLKSFGKEKTKLVDLYQPRGFLEAKLKDSVTGKTMTVFDTHMALDRKVRADQAKKLVEHANAAAKNGGVLIAGDLNTLTKETDPKGADAGIRKIFEGFEDMGASTAADRTFGGKAANIDWVLGKGFEAVSSDIHTGQELNAPDGRDAKVISDHYAEDDVVRFK